MRGTENIATLTAIGAITGLKYGIHNSYEIPYIIAIAGGIMMIRYRMK
ncbi:MAG: hypothetical protein IJ773_01545 [Lachnospiraceae bacterium]|nr:hypothetical protein [Lachnospiraceae bacterium]